MAGGSPQGAGGAGPHEEVHRHGEGAPRALGTGQKEAFRRERMETQTDSGHLLPPGGGHRGARGVRPETQAQVGGLGDVGAESSHPQAQLPAFHSQSISWQREERAEGQKAGETGRGRGTKKRDPGRGRGAMQMRESTGSSALNKSCSSGSWYHRVSQAAGSSAGEAGCPKQRGALALCTPGTTALVDIKRRPAPQQPESGWRPLRAGRRWVPILGTRRHPPALSRLLRVLMPSRST